MRGRSASMLRISVALCACLPILLASAAGAQSSSGAPPAGNAAAQLPAFEVATIKPNKSGGTGSHTSSDHGRFTATNVTVKTLLQYDAYSIPGAQITGGPSWLGSDRFDISAKVDDATAARMEKLDNAEENLFNRQLMQQLLADRFKLSVHWETKEEPVYALVLAKSGAKLTAAKDATGTSVSTRNGHMTAKGITMADMVKSLTRLQELGRIVIDKTGLNGRYDLTLEWTPENNSAPTPGSASQIPSSSGPSIFTAIQEQLGLKLESVKGPVSTLVVDHIEPPSEN